MRPSITSRISRTSSTGLPAGSGMSQSSTRVGTYGQTSPHPIVTAQSACSCISTVNRFGLRSETSIPTSRITSITSGHNWRAGSDPADSPRQSPGQDRSNSAWAICERPALWVHTNRTYFIGSSYLRGRNQLVGVLPRQSGGGDLASDCLGVVGDALDRRPDQAGAVEL